MGGTHWHACITIVGVAEVKIYRTTMGWIACQRVPVDRGIWPVHAHSMNGYGQHRGK